jgi:VanZ family protein
VIGDQAGTGPGAETLARQARAWAPPAAVMAAIFILSAQPGLRLSDDPDIELPVRQLAHLAAYAVLAALFLPPLDGFAPRRAMLVALVLATLWGASDEMHQVLVEDRHGAPSDVLVDAAGALLGIAGLHSWRRWRRSRRA